MTTDRLYVPELSADEQGTLDALWTQLKAKTPRNLIRAAYYDGKNAVRDLGISTPPSFRRIATVLGWSAKAVDILNRRCNLDGFVVPGITDTSDIDRLWTENYLDTEASQAGVSSLIHAAAFLVVTQGDEESGEPPVLITAKDA
ncbi:MAG TPA: portal protein, partial [Coriobacteriia bacterium]|nr:portal protein [Coriobacteriia bacterium]